MADFFAGSTGYASTQLLDGIRRHKGGYMFNSYSLERWLEERMAAAEVPGVAIAVVRGGEVVYARGLGMTSVEEGGLPVTPRTLFPLASVTKPLTGTMIMRLVEQGVLELDTPVMEYLPWFALSELGAAQHVTLRMLLSHTSGLSNPFEPYGRRDPEGLGEYVRNEVPKLRLLARPGAVYSYCNANLNIAGYIAEAVTGRWYTDLMGELVFRPLKMERTTFARTVAMTYPLAQEHYLDEGGEVRVRHHFADNTAHYPAGFAISNVLDLGNFAVMHLAGGRFGGEQILTPESVAQMHRTQAQAYTLDRSGCGLTFVTGTHKGQRRVGHGGGLGGYNSSFTMLPDQGAAVVILSNRLTPELALLDIAGGILDDMLDIHAAPAAIAMAEPNRASWSLCAGSYLSPYYGVVEVRVGRDGLELRRNGDPIALEPVTEDLYSGCGEGGEVVSAGFVLGDGESVVEYVVIDGNVYKRVQIPSEPLAPDELHGYMGEYGVGPEDEHPVVVRVEGGQLLIGWPPCLMRSLALGRGHFANARGVFEFVRAEDGRVLGVKMWD